MNLYPRLKHYLENGKAVDVIGGNDGLLIGNVVSEPGLLDSALKFDGNGDWVKITTGNFNFEPEGFTLALWVNFSALVNNEEQTIIEKYIETFRVPRVGWTLTKVPGHNIVFGGGDTPGGAILNFFPEDGIIPNEWYFIAITRSGNQFDLYWQGSLVQSVTITNASGNPLDLSSPDTASLKFGHRRMRGDGEGNESGWGHGPYGFYLNGFVDEVRIFRQALTASQIAAIYHSDLSGFRISSVLPKTGGNTGTVTITVRGGGFQEGAVVRLLEGDNVVMTGQNNIVTDQRQIQSTFDFQGQTPRELSLQVLNPDGTSLIAAEPFIIEETGQAKTWVDIVGRTEVLVGRTPKLGAIVGNSGNINSPELMLIVTHFSGTDSPIIQLEDVGVVSSGGYDFHPVAGVPFGKDDSSDCDKYKIRLDGSDKLNPLCNSQSIRDKADYLEKLEKLDKDIKSLQDDIRNLQVEIDLSIIEINMLTNRISALECDVNNPTALCQSLFKDLSDEHSSLVAAQIAIKLKKIELASKETEKKNNFKDDFEKIKNRLSDEILLYQKLCPKNPVVEELSEKWGKKEFAEPPLAAAEMTVCPVSSLDPNDKKGRIGVEDKMSNGPKRYIGLEQPLSYEIFFENLDSATAPAQEVIITDQLDSAKLNLNTFSFGLIMFGDRQVIPPAGAYGFDTTVDLRPDKNLLVKINAALDQATGIVTWRFTSIDPDTGELPDDPFGGFLPPNVNPPEGEGSVAFNAMLKDGQPTGTEILNNATIVFDLNEPITTPVWLNTLDTDEPISQVQSLASIQTSPTFPVQWSGTDVGSGIKDYTIFVSENSGPFTEWLSNTLVTSENFIGQPGRNYAFYSVARDETGNVEDAPAVPDATTQVAQDSDGDLIIDELAACRGNRRGGSINGQYWPFSRHFPLRMLENRLKNLGNLHIVG